MREIWQHIAELDPSRENVLLTSLNEESLGEKVLFVDSEAFFSTSDFDCPTIDFNEKKRGFLSLGEQRFFLDNLAGEKKLIVLGAGHVALSVIRLGKMIGFQVLCIEDRPSFAKAAKEAGADEVLCEDFAKALSSLKGDKDSYFVIVTRGHTHDLICLREILKKSHAYIGMMGSKRRVTFIKKQLLEEGVSEESLQELHSPIGLAIGAETPMEIGLSVLSEIVMEKNKSFHQESLTKEMLDAMLSGEDYVLATIVRRQGSAPREAGTKMLISPLGKLIGTIGGGCAEAEVVQKSRELFLENAKPACLYHVDLADDIAAEEGMVCGGQLDVLLERV